jgi:ammonia channel protein AmtB
MGGSAGLAAALMTGPRIGRFERNGNLNHIQPHSIPVLAIYIKTNLFNVSTILYVDVIIKN